jgi:hypothetical protein
MRYRLRTLLILVAIAGFGAMLFPHWESRGNQQTGETRYDARLGLWFSPFVTATWSTSKSGDTVADETVLGRTKSKNFSFGIHFISLSLLCGVTGEAALLLRKRQLNGPDGRSQRLAETEGLLKADAK